MRPIVIPMIVVLGLVLSGCADYLFKKNQDNFWKQTTPYINKIVD